MTLKPIPGHLHRLHGQSEPLLPSDQRAFWLSSSVSHDDQFAVAVASTGRVGVDVEKMSERVLKSRSLFMREQEEALGTESRLGEVETAVRIWSIKEAVTKALDITLTDAWNRVQVRNVGASESRFQIDDQDRFTAVHAWWESMFLRWCVGCEIKQSAQRSSRGGRHG